ncbi:hypothetical protein BJY24_002698 [Nocardia transvalensis]|uniref:VOC domain-containing protein n=1 Tax=Nocardia transvalensis TaxID=37333 RepID=A0A7W9UI29_9NOCA|nr:VOC family protein [Nocardia transvalensis]MBB5913831.1 hypothetical protein [Nocardia transvalensis]
MTPRINAITLGVSDLERALGFYRDGMGLATPGIIGTEFARGDGEPGGAVAMFTLDSGLMLSLYSRIDLGLDAGVATERIAGSPMSLGWFVDRGEDVDAVLEQAVRAGGTLVRAATERPWGIYAGYFADPDEHLWEVVHFLTN